MNDFLKASESDMASTVSNMLKIIWSAVGLVVCAVGGVLVNNEVKFFKDKNHLSVQTK